MRYFHSPHHLTASYAVIMAVVMLLPGGLVPSAPSFRWTDKALHLVLFLVMTMLSIRSTRVSGRLARPVMLGVALTSVYAVLLEALQGVIPGRSWDPADLFAGALGILGGALLQSMAKRG